MRRNITAAGILALIAVMMFGVLVSAAAPQITISLNGQVTSNTRSEQIWLELSSNDSQGWYLDIVLNVPTPTNREGGEDHENSRVSSNASVNGYFTIDKQQNRLSTGTVTGNLGSNNNGNIQLVDSNGPTSINMMFSIARDGLVTATASGQWPNTPAPSVISPTTPTQVNTIPVIPVTKSSSTSPTVIIAGATPTTPAGVVTMKADPSPQVPVKAEPANGTSQPDNLPFGGHFFWYISRTSAIVAYMLLFLNICLGIALKTRYLDALMGRWRVFDLHQFTALLGVSLILVHIFSLLGDTYFNYSVSELLVPMASPYRPLWVTLGTISIYTCAVIALSYYIRKLIKQKTWRILHYVSYFIFFVILCHGIKSGTDTSSIWVKWMYISTGTMVAFLFLWRLVSYRAVSTTPQDPLKAYIRKNLTRLNPE